MLVETPSKLQSHLSASSLEEKTFNRLFDQFGPLLPVGAVWRLLDYPTRDAFNRAILKKRLLLRVIRPPGRREGFVATTEVATYLAALATESTKEEISM